MDWNSGVAKKNGLKTICCLLFFPSPSLLSAMWMPKSKHHPPQPPVLPSFHAFCQTIDHPPKSHTRTASMPIRLPSQSDNRLSLDVLLDAIELDQHMYEAYEHEWTKSAIRAGQRNAYRRRRSKSAPGVPRWRTPCSSTKSRNVSVQQIAESIVQKHIESARKK